MIAVKCYTCNTLCVASFLFELLIGTCICTVIPVAMEIGINQHKMHAERGREGRKDAVAYCVR